MNHWMKKIFSDWQTFNLDLWSRLIYFLWQQNELGKREVTAIAYKFYENQKALKLIF